MGARRLAPFFQLSLLDAEAFQLDNPYQTPNFHGGNNAPTSDDELNNAKITFQRALLLLALVVFVIPTALAVINGLTKALTSNAATQQNGSRLDELIDSTGWPLLLFVFVLIAISIWNYFELYQCKRMSREIAILITIVGLLPIGLFSTDLPESEPPTFSQLDYVAALLWGGIISMSYCEPYDKLFPPRTK